MADSDLTPLHWLQNIDIISGCGIDDTLKDNVVIDLTDYKTTNKKPNLSYSSLIVRAIKSTPCKKMTLSQIYAWIKENYIYYAKARPAWQNSIRHNLSLNRCFTKIPRSKDDPGKGGFWGFDETQSGQTNKRRKKKKKKPKENSKNENTDQTVIIDNSQNIIPTSPISASEPTYIIQLTNEDDSGQLMGTSVSTITATDLAGTIDPTIVSSIFEPTQQLIHEHQQLEQHQLQLDLAQGQQEQMSQTIILAASAPTIEVDDGQDLELGYETSVEDTISSESLLEPSLQSSGRARYSSTSSLSSAATATSPCTAGVPTQSAMTMSNVIPSNNQSPASSPQRPLSSSPTTIPLSLITTNYSTSSSNDSTSSLKITPVVSNGLSNNLTNSITNHHHNGGSHIAINFTTSEGVISPALITASTSAMPINLNVSKAAQISQGLQIITTTNNNNITTNKMLNCKNGVRSTIEHQQQTQQAPLHNANGRDIPKAETSKKSENEPPTKVLKLINRSAILASVVDKDHKLIPAGLTLSQVVSLPVRVIGPSPMATIELSNSNVQRNHNHLQTAIGAQLQKLLVNGTTANITTANTVMTTSSNKITNEFPRLPGGAELNILPTTNGTNLYRSNGKVAIINNGFNIKEFLNTTEVNSTNGRSVHMVTPVQSNSTPMSGLTPIVVSQGQNGTSLTHIIASSPQLGKVVTTPLSVNGQGLPIMGTQYLSTAVVKPVVVTVAGSGNTVHNGSITLPITSTSATNTSNL